MKALRALPVLIAFIIAAAPSPASATVAATSTASSTGAVKGRPAPVLPETFADVVDEVKGAVVNISTTGGEIRMPRFWRPYPRYFKEWRGPFEEFFYRFFGDDPHRGLKKKSLGSGFIVEGEGYILTNHHVIEEAEEILVMLEDGREFKAEVVGSDEETDIALIKIDSPGPLPAVVMGDSEAIRVGQWVLAIGNPFGLGHTVTVGVVSARERSLGRDPYNRFIQTDASINFGNSGGPLIDMEGRVIGINTAIYPQGEGISFAVPINTARDILHDLREKGAVVRGWLGIYVQNLTPELAESFGLPSDRGAIVSRVLPESPAERGGLRRGDVIVSFQGEEIADTRDLIRAVRETKPGTVAAIRVAREGDTLHFQVEVGRKGEKKAAGAVTEMEGKLGISLQELTPELAKALNVEGGKGALISGVRPGSSADEAGLRRGDVILEIEWVQVSGPADVQKALEKDHQKERLLLLINRRGRNFYLALKR